MIPRSSQQLQAIAADKSAKGEKSGLTEETTTRHFQQPAHETGTDDIGLASAELIKTPSSNWQTQLAKAIKTPEALCEFLQLDPAWLPGADSGHALFNIRVPHAYLERIKPGNPNDPLLRQVLPLNEESQVLEGFVSDPLDEAEHRPCPGLIHKYKSRVLLIGSGACAINCRYCFRRHFPYSDNTLSQQSLDTIVSYLKAHPEINEVILSGGDPLASSDKRLAKMVAALESVPHLIRLRIHTRLPVVIPDRVDEALLDWLRNTRLQTVLVLHINHPQEIDRAVENACKRLTTAGVTLLNQSVLLRGVNDQVETLKMLSETLFAIRVLPYYLHVLDPVAGAAHFDVPDEEAKSLVAALRKEISGFLVPRLVREIPGEASKTPLL
ncbi:L-lysine 2,3-aminomutase [Halomonadaceae bacterium LMG 33818]|uniref:EF-P beta-lysylation protein EpmB n=1 Tax=Cernens ardua TaxID=3402176 RepID=UPI003EDC4FEF